MAGRPTLIGRIAVALPAVLAATLALAGSTSASAAAAASGVTAGPAGISAEPSGAASPDAVAEFWTPERIEAAPPLGEALAGSGLGNDPEAAPPPGASLDPVPFSTTGGLGRPELFRGAPHGVILRNPTTYPNRVHGKLVGTFLGLGSFACSATVVSSGSGSLIVSAGHCAYDPFVGFARNLAFAPGYSRDDTPYGVWPITNVIVPKDWAVGTKLDYDVSFMRVAPAEGVRIQEAVGSRGIAFNQPRRRRMKAYGYPATGSPRYDGMKLVRCNSGYVKDPARGGGPPSVGMRCTMKKGASGGGWVVSNSYLVSETSHGYPDYSDKQIFGPYFGRVVRGLYKARQKGWPSIKPVRCRGRVATIVGSDARDRIRGTAGDDVIAGLGGDDVIAGGRGDDVICGGAGDDVLRGNRANDFLDGGAGEDFCNGGVGRNRFSNCEIERG